MVAATEEINVLLGVGRPAADVSHIVTEMVLSFDGSLRRFLRRRVRCHHDAEDLAQEVYLRIARHENLGRVECMKAFAYQTALNLVRDRSRRAYTRSRSRSVPIESIDLPGGDDPFEHALHDERLSQLAGALESLPAPTRRALLLHRVEGLSYAEIAADLGVSVSMVEKHISAALAALRDEAAAN